MTGKCEHRCPQQMAPAPRKHTVRVLYAMRNGFLYRSVDGINWTLKSDLHAMRLSIAEGTTVAAYCTRH